MTCSPSLHKINDLRVGIIDRIINLINGINVRDTATILVDYVKCMHDNHMIKEKKKIF